MVNESDEDDEDLEDDSETGAMLRQSSDRSGKTLYLKQYNAYEFFNFIYIKDFWIYFSKLGGESIRMYGGRRADDNPKSKFPTLMDDNSD